MQKRSFLTSDALNYFFLFQFFTEVVLWLKIEFVKVAQIAQARQKDIQVVTCKNALVLQTSDWNNAQGTVYTY